MSRKPQLILSSLDVDRLEALLEAMPASAFLARRIWRPRLPVPISSSPQIFRRMW